MSPASDAMLYACDGNGSFQFIDQDYVTDPDGTRTTELYAIYEPMRWRCSAHHRPEPRPRNSTRSADGSSGAAVAHGFGFLPPLFDRLDLSWYEPLLLPWNPQ